MALRKMLVAHGKDAYEVWMTVDTDTYEVKRLELKTLRAARVGRAFKLKIRVAGVADREITSTSVRTRGVNLRRVFHGRGRKSGDHGNFRGVEVSM